MDSAIVPSPSHSTRDEDGSLAAFRFPAYHSFPPFYTPQPNASTRLSQLRKWSSLIQAYCRHHCIWRLSLVEAVDTPLFHNKAIQKRVSLAEARRIVDWMCSDDGENRAEWAEKTTGAGAGSKVTAFVWWRRPEEWASIIYDWVDRTGQKKTILTLYELTEGDETSSQEFHGMDAAVMRKALAVLAENGKASVFGAEDEQGVKFF
ncbi:hypothetical protein KEM52_003617 [Ascosphaera acerosa]|nr:hypothetical protein KEM52_003617 [Ascosphaera acerosa]